MVICQEMLLILGNYRPAGADRIKLLKDGAGEEIAQKSLPYND